MKRADVTTLFRELNAAGVRYLVAGGLAVVAHGYVRLTVDVDLAMALDRDNLNKAVVVFKRLGYRPRLPVAMEDFADAETRRFWVEEKQMMVFSLLPPEPGGAPVDLFARLPFDFDAELEQAQWFSAGDGGRAPFVRLERLIQMKEDAGRPKDQLDLQQLKMIREAGQS